jgi:hypothetical protein
MPEQQPLEPSDIDRPMDNRLPVPATDPSTGLPARNTRDGARLATRTFGAGPVLAASMIGAAAAAAVTGAAVAARMLWPWMSPVLRDVVPPAEQAPPVARWLGPGFHVSYTHVEIHWTGDR